MRNRWAASCRSPRYLRVVAGRRRCAFRWLPDLGDRGLPGPEVKARNRLYQPERAPIPAPIVSDCRIMKKALVIRSEDEVPVLLVVEDDGLALGDVEATAEAEAAEVLAAVVAVTELWADGEVEADATAVGEAEAFAPLTSPTATELIPRTANNVRVANSDAVAPASQVARGAKKPASIGGMSGGMKMNWKRAMVTASDAQSLVRRRKARYVPEARQMRRAGQIALVLKIRWRRLLMSSM